MKSETAAPKLSDSDLRWADEGQARPRKGFFKIGSRRSTAKPIHFLEINGSRKFEMAMTAYLPFWFKCLHEPRLSNKENSQSSKTIQLPRPVDDPWFKSYRPCSTC